jgi:hypothetical protein
MKIKIKKFLINYVQIFLLSLYFKLKKSHKKRKRKVGGGEF